AAKEYLSTAATPTVTADRITVSEGIDATKRAVELWLCPKGAEKPVPTDQGTRVIEEEEITPAVPEPAKPRAKRGKTK
ncbi:MAG TPA: hypothetical protein VIW74_09220, partial [Pyrinomonadaceae bacterium]